MKKHNTGHTRRQTSTRTYRFEFGTDEKLYSISFRGIIPETEIHMILEAVHSTLYEKCSETIRLYLDSHHLEYSDFTSVNTPLEHDSVMAAADILLHNISCENLDSRIGDTDEYYAVMDYQRQTNESCFEGCYFAISRISSGQQNKYYEHRIVGQIFRYNVSSGKEQSFFAVRQAPNSHCLHTTDMKNGCPVLAIFGCVDVMNLLIHINSVTSRNQAAELANR